MLDPNALETFVAVARDLHFSRTADRLGIAQSVVSKQVRRLEDQLGARLFERGRRAAVRLTAEGATFLVEAELALAQMQRAEQIGRLAARGEAGVIRIGYVFSAAPAGLLVAALDALRRRYPHATLEVTPLETPEQVRALAEGRIDIGFLRPGGPLPAGIASTVVHQEGMILALSDSHPLARRDRIRAADLSAETFVVPQFSEASGLIDTLVRLARKGGFAMRPFVRTRDYVTSVCLAAGGTGLVLAPASIARLVIAGVSYRTIDDYPDPVAIALAHRVDARPALVATIMAACGPTGPSSDEGAQGAR